MARTVLPQGTNKGSSPFDLATARVAKAYSQKALKKLLTETSPFLTFLKKGTMEDRQDPAAELLKELAKKQKLVNALRQITLLTGLHKGKKAMAIARKALNDKHIW